MPPSGYNIFQSNQITNFLNSCFSALLKEGEIENRSLRESLEKEIDDINYFLNNDKPLPTVISVLNLTKSFYERVLAGLLNSECENNINLLTANIIKEIEKEILAVHIINRERITA